MACGTFRGYKLACGMFLFRLWDVGGDCLFMAALRRRRLELWKTSDMKTKHCSELLSLFALLFLGASLSAQTMPQDNWRYNQHQFTGPDPSQILRSIAIGSGGVYVGRGSPATAIWQFKENGVYIRQFGTFGAIRGIACDSAGNVYVLDAGNSTIKAFDPNGNALRQWGSAGTNDAQFNLTVDATTMLAVDPNDQIYACDPGNRRVQVFDTQGVILRKWGVAGSLPGQFPANYPQAIAASPNGWIYSNCSKMSIFDSSGNYIKLPAVPKCDAWDGTGYGIDNSVAVSTDGILLCKLTTYNGSSNPFFACVDLNSGRFFSFAFSPSSIAFNKRGDLYAITGLQVQIYEREYSSVQNPPTPPALPEPIVLAVAQRANTAWLDVDYKVVHAESSNVTAAALAFINGGNTLSAAVPMSTFMEGTASNLGANVPCNTNLRFTWNMGADWSIDFAQIQVEVLAKDTRNLMGFHWITVPTDGTNTAFQASSAPVPESELLSVWYWFIATHNPGVTFANGIVRGVTGGYAGQTLASDAGTTSLGRTFAYSQMGVRAITQAEINRINAGSYGFTSVSANTVVKLP